MTARRAPAASGGSLPSPSSRVHAYRSTPSARCAMSCRRAATVRHCAAAQAALRTRSVLAHGCCKGAHPSGAALEGAQRSKSSPRPRARMERMTLVIGPPRAAAPPSAATASKAARHQWAPTVPARRALTAVMIGPIAATAA
eukprot:9054386-Lingulodinium_polyedra.AAC.1